jgi:hypothetical protein
LRGRFRGCSHRDPHLSEDGVERQLIVTIMRIP